MRFTPLLDWFDPVSGMAKHMIWCMAMRVQKTIKRMLDILLELEESSQDDWWCLRGSLELSICNEAKCEGSWLA